MEAVGLTGGTPTARQSPFLLVLSSLPGLVGSGLGLIYGLGTVETTSQLLAEDLRVIDWFPVIPLPQILAKGIVLTQGYLLLFVVTTVLFGLLLSFVRFSDARDLVRKALARFGVSPPTGPPPVWFPILLLPLLLASTALTVYLLLDSPWILVATTPVTWAYLALCGGVLKPRIGLARAAALSALGFVAIAGVLGAFLLPDRLPEATLTLRDTTSISGKLITATGNQWYLSQGDKVRVIPDTRVAEASVESSPDRRFSDDLPTVGELIGDVF